MVGWDARAIVLVHKRPVHFDHGLDKKCKRLLPYPGYKRDFLNNSHLFNVQISQQDDYTSTINLKLPSSHHPGGSCMLPLSHAKRMYSQPIHITHV